MKLNYNERLALAVASRQDLFASRVVCPEIAHDDWCGVYKRMPCNCNPDITVMVNGAVYAIDENGEVALKGQSQ